MGKLIAIVPIALAVLGAWAFTATNGDDAAMVARGEYLVTFGDCTACHTPWKMGPRGPEPDVERLFSGHPQDVELPSPPELPAGPWNMMTGGMTAWAGPWGISFGTNLTSDEETGLGGWTEEMFVEAMRTGTHLGMGRDFLPPMPRYPSLTDEDLKAMFAYFMTVPPIANQVPDPVPPKEAQ